MKFFKKFAVACAICVGLCGLFSLTFAGNEQGKVFNKDYTGIKEIEATITTHEGVIVLDLDFKSAPNTVANFIELANSGFYNGLRFHRVIQGFMIQGGDPMGNGTGGPGYTINDEISKLVHDAGVISMANRGPNTNGSQFFITQTPQHHLDGKHTVFGHVLQGLDVVCRVEQNDPIINIKIVEKK
ncbi:MAG: peptidylprolyl isomerase [Fibrobacter sp.]|nr:peptidylprolyl isomerase [Fibrobacter sp.]